MTLADLRRNLERQMIVQRVQQNEVLGKIGVTEEEAPQVLRGAPERVHARRRRSRCARFWSTVPGDATALNVGGRRSAREGGARFGSA